MTSVGKSSIVVFVALLCFASSAFGQTTGKVQGPSAANGIFSLAPSFFTLALGVGHDHKRGDHDGGGDGCGNTEGGDRGWDWGGGGDNRGGGCNAVPEGGTTLTYLSLAGLCCLGAVGFKSRRQVSVSETSN